LTSQSLMPGISPKKLICSLACTKRRTPTSLLLPVSRFVDERIVGLHWASEPALGWCDMHNTCILICMRTTLNLDDALLKEAQRLSGLSGKTAVIHAGLRALIARESARRLAQLGGSERALEPIRRRRPGKGT
jgi:Arc/MetJ family transcription regulator